jgi:hypothetical protein
VLVPIQLSLDDSGQHTTLFFYSVVPPKHKPVTPDIPRSDGI